MLHGREALHRLQFGQGEVLQAGRGAQADEEAHASLSSTPSSLAQALTGCRRKYYERNNFLIQHYMYIDRILDSSLPHNLIQEYSTVGSGQVDIPSTINEESHSSGTTPTLLTPGGYTDPTSTPVSGTTQGSNGSQVKLKRTPKNLYKVPEETTPLLPGDEEEDIESPRKDMPDWVPEEDEDTESPIVKLALYVNMAANTVLLILKIIVTIMTSSLSVIASLVDAALDFLSTAIVWFTSWMIARQDRYAYPVGRRRLEPIGVLVFSVVMITSFFQVSIEGFSRLTGTDYTVVQLTIPAVAIMASTVVIKGLCWLWCRLIRNSSVQALAQDAQTDVVFNIFSIIFPLSMTSFTNDRTSPIPNSSQSDTTLKYGGLIPSAASCSRFS